jgi:hypothetical protein
MRYIFQMPYFQIQIARGGGGVPEPAVLLLRLFPQDTVSNHFLNLKNVTVNWITIEHDAFDTGWFNSFCSVYDVSQMEILTYLISVYVLPLLNKKHQGLLLLICYHGSIDTQEVF